MSAARLPLAAAARRLADARAAPRERRRFRRTPLALTGRMLDPAGLEHDCRTEDISPGDVRVFASADLAVGARVVLYLKELGRVSGRIVRACGPQEYAIVFDVTAHKREKLAEALTLLLNPSVRSDREAPSAPENARNARIELDEGGAIEGVVLDFSLAGITVQSLQPPPPVGAWVRVGGVHGRVARYIDGGFSVDFEIGRRPPAS